MRTSHIENINHCSAALTTALTDAIEEHRRQIKLCEAALTMTGAISAGASEISDADRETVVALAAKLKPGEQPRRAG